MLYPMKDLLKFKILYFALVLILLLLAFLSDERDCLLSVDFVACLDYETEIMASN